MEKKRRKIVFLMRDEGGCGFMRIQQPASFIKRMGLADTEVLFKTATKEQLMNADLVIFQELGSVEGSNMARFCVENKIPYIAEFDDFLQHVSPNNEGGYPAWNPGTLFVHRAMETAKNAVAITVSTEQLAREYFPYNKTIYVAPNWLDKDAWNNPVMRRSDGKIRIGWAGGNAHADDLRMISKVLDKVIKESKGNVLFETIGMTKKELHGVFPMEEFSSTCPHCGYDGEMHYFPGEAIENYPLVLSSKGWDFAVAPVIENAFNNCKSNIKIMEYAACGLPVIASPVKPYIESRENGAQVLIASTFKEWYDAIISLVKSSKKRDEMAQNNKQWAQKNWIQDHAQELYSIYEREIQRAEVVLGTKEARLRNTNML